MFFNLDSLKVDSYPSWSTKIDVAGSIFEKKWRPLPFTLIFSFPKNLVSECWRQTGAFSRKGSHGPTPTDAHPHSSLHPQKLIKYGDLRCVPRVTFVVRAFLFFFTIEARDILSCKTTYTMANIGHIWEHQKENSIKKIRDMTRIETQVHVSASELLSLIIIIIIIVYFP